MTAEVVVNTKRRFTHDFTTVAEATSKSGDFDGSSSERSPAVSMAASSGRDPLLSSIA